MQYHALQKKIKSLLPGLSSGLQDIKIDSHPEKIFINNNDNKFIQWQTTEEYQRHSRGLKVTFNEVPTFDNIGLPAAPDEKIPDSLNLEDAVHRIESLCTALEKRTHDNATPSTGNQSGEIASVIVVLDDAAASVTPEASDKKTGYLVISDMNHLIDNLVDAMASMSMHDTVDQSPR